MARSKSARKGRGEGVICADGFDGDIRAAAMTDKNPRVAEQALFPAHLLRRRSWIKRGYHCDGFLVMFEKAPGAPRPAVHSGAVHW